MLEVNKSKARNCAGFFAKPRAWLGLDDFGFDPTLVFKFKVLRIQVWCLNIKEQEKSNNSILNIVFKTPDLFL
jgi:hypothetical protein